MKRLWKTLIATLGILLLVCGAWLTARITSTQAATVTATTPVVGMARTSNNKGYWIVTQDGAIYSFGNAVYHGGANQFNHSGTIIGLVATSTDGGYWEVGNDGGVYSFGDAHFYGSMAGHSINAPIVGIARTPSSGGYWLVGADGGVYSFGDAHFYGSMGGKSINAPVSGIVATSTGQGYWLVGQDGGVYAFGAAHFYGSMGGQHLNAPVVGIDRTSTNGGYWLVGADGGIFSFGDASFHGSMGGHVLNAPMVRLAVTSENGGYWEVGSDGGIFAFGTAQYYGNVTVTAPPNQTGLQRVVSIAQAIENGQAEPGWRGGLVPYSWDGGHGPNPGPSLGICDSTYTGPKPCLANRTVGVDCSGFVRWVYSIAYGKDVLPGNTDNQIKSLQPVSAAAVQPGDLVFYGYSITQTKHVGIYLGNGQIIDALKTGTNVETDSVTKPISGSIHLVGYYHYNG